MYESWETQRGPMTRYVQIVDRQVVVGEHAGSGHTDNATSTDLASFLAGHLQDLVRSHHGPSVLAEVRAAAQAALETWPGSAEQRRERRRLDFLAALPARPELAALARDPATEHGRRTYGNAGGTRTRLASTTRTLLLTQGEAKVLDAAGRPVGVTTLEGSHGGVVALDDHFYALHSHNVAVIDPDGALIWDSFEGWGDEALLGTQLRLEDIYRHERTLFVRYRWFANEHPEGFLALDPRGGFVGHGAGV